MPERTGANRDRADVLQSMNAHVEEMARTAPFLVLPEFGCSNLGLCALRVHASFVRAHAGEAAARIRGQLMQEHGIATGANQFAGAANP